MLGWAFGPGRRVGRMWNASFAQTGIAAGASALVRLHRKLDRRQPRPRRLHLRRCAVCDGLTAPPSGGP
ncbi:hypothetical protein ABZ498_35265 [Streptomyces lavendulocolor]